MTTKRDREKARRPAPAKGEKRGAASAPEEPGANPGADGGEKAARLNIIFLKDLSFEEAARQKAAVLLKNLQDRKDRAPIPEPQTASLSESPAAPNPEPSAGPEEAPGGLLDCLIAPFEKAFIEVALLVSKGDQTKTARRLGLNRNTLRKKMDRFQSSSVFSKPFFSTEISGRDMIVSSYEDLDLEEAVRRKLWIFWKNSQKIPNFTAEVRPVIEKTVIEIALKHVKGRKTKAAALSGLSRETLARKIKLYKIPDFKEKELF